MHKDKKAKILVLEAQEEARKQGMIYFLLILLAGLALAFLWKWYAIAVAIGAGIAFNFWFSIRKVREISRRTGLSPEEQSEIIKNRPTGAVDDNDGFESKGEEVDNEPGGNQEKDSADSRETVWKGDQD